MFSGTAAVSLRSISTTAISPASTAAEEIPTSLRRFRDSIAVCAGSFTSTPSFGTCARQGPTRGGDHLKPGASSSSWIPICLGLVPCPPSQLVPLLWEVSSMLPNSGLVLRRAIIQVWGGAETAARRPGSGGPTLFRASDPLCLIGSRSLTNKCTLWLHPETRQRLVGLTRVR